MRKPSGDLSAVIAGADVEIAFSRNGNMAAKPVTTEFKPQPANHSPANHCQKLSGTFIAAKTLLKQLR